MTLKKIRFLLEYLVFLLFSALIRNLSCRSVYFLARRVGILFYRLSRKRRHIARTNIDIAFADSKSNEEKEQILQNSFIQFMVTAFQCLWVGKDSQERVQEIIEGEPEGLDLLRECLADGKGVFFLTAHYGNWEVMGLYHGYQKTGLLHSIARRMDNPYLERYIMKLRTVSGNRVLHKDQSPIKLVRALKENSCVAVMMDHNAGIGGTFVDFFGKKAAAPRSLPLLSYSTGAPIIPLFSYPTTMGKYKIVYGPVLKLEKSGNKEEDLLRWTQACQSFIETVIRDKPEPWMWVHRRWKSRPENERHINLYE